MALKQPVSLLNLSTQALGSHIANHAVCFVETDHLEIGNINGKEEQKLSNGKEEQKLSNSKEEIKLSNGKEEQKLSNGKEEQKLSNGKEEQKLSNGKEEQKLSNSKEEQKLSNGKEEQKLSNGKEEQKLSNGKEEQKLSNSKEEQKLSNGKEEQKLSIKKCAEDYDAIIPPSLHNLVTYYALQYMKENKVQIPEENDLVIDIVLRSHVTKFDFSDWPLEMHSMLYRNLSKLKHLKLLRVKHLEKNNLSYVIEGVKVMKNLEKFECHRGFSDDLLKVLCDNSTLLSLTMKGGFIIDSSLGDLLKLHNLQELNILGTHISDHSLREILLGLPQLKTLLGIKEFGMIPEPDIVTSLESVQLICLCKKHVENLIDFCPSVRNLKLFGMVDTDASESLDLSRLANLHNLTTFYVWSGCFYASNIKAVLKKIGHQITDLGFYDIHNISLATLLDEINTSCPNLKILRISACDTDDVNPSGNQHVFQNLQSVDLSVFRNMTSCSIYFLCSCLNIREVYFGLATELCDDDIDMILSCNPLTHLQELCIANHKLTAKSIYKLLSSCGELRYIGFVDRHGTLNYWATITDSEIEELRNYIQKNNLNVEFVSNYKDIEEKKRVSVMKPEWSNLSQSALYMKGRHKPHF